MITEVMRMVMRGVHERSAQQLTEVMRGMITEVMRG